MQWPVPLHSLVYGCLREN